MRTTREKIYYILVNTKDHAISKRDILMRLSYRKDFRQVYALLIMEGTITEHGTGTKGNTKLVRLANPGRALSD